MTLLVDVDHWSSFSARSEKREHSSSNIHQSTSGTYRAKPSPQRSERRKEAKATQKNKMTAAKKPDALNK